MASVLSMMVTAASKARHPVASYHEFTGFLKDKKKQIQDALHEARQHKIRTAGKLALGSAKLAGRATVATASFAYRWTLGSVVDVARKHPYMTALVAGGIAVVAVTGLVLAAMAFPYMLPVGLVAGIGSVLAAVAAYTLPAALPLIGGLGISTFAAVGSFSSFLMSLGVVALAAAGVTATASLVASTTLNLGASLGRMAGNLFAKAADKLNARFPNLATKPVFKSLLAGADARAKNKGRVDEATAVLSTFSSAAEAATAKTISGLFNGNVRAAERASALLDRKNAKADVAAARAGEAAAQAQAEATARANEALRGMLETMQTNVADLESQLAALELRAQAESQAREGAEAQTRAVFAAAAAAHAQPVAAAAAAASSVGFFATDDAQETRSRSVSLGSSQGSEPEDQAPPAVPSEDAVDDEHQQPGLGLSK